MTGKVVLDRGDDDVELRIEVVEHGARRHPGPTADLTGRGVPQTDLSDRLDGRVDDEVDRLGPAFGVRPATTLVTWAGRGGDR